MKSEQDFGKGGILSPIDPRDFSYKGFSSIPYDWNVPFNIKISPELKNQGSSGSCGGQAMSYYGEVLEALNDGTPEERSAKFIYAQIFIPPAGTFLRDLCDVVIKQGWAREAVLSSYENGNPPTEAFMERVQDITPEVKLDASRSQALSYANVPLNFDSIAMAVRDNNGAIILIGGNNNGTWLSEYPQPPITKNEWQHFLYVCGMKMENGKKYINVLNSWGNVGVNGYQWLSEDYMPWIWECRTLVFKKAFIFNKNLSFGMRNKDVLELQKRMVLEKCGTYTPTGYFGILTWYSVIKYQKTHNISGTGFVGVLTRSELNR